MLGNLWKETMTCEITKFSGGLKRHFKGNCVEKRWKKSLYTQKKLKEVKKLNYGHKSVF
jgi:hypothetical protein